MSEYRYYEFRAIDRSLDAAERDELRRISSRAEITSTSFVNEYNWGSLKADPARLVESYFDAYLSVTSYGFRELMLRLPLGALDLAAVQPYQTAGGLHAWETDSHLVLHFRPEFEDNTGDAYWEATDLLDDLVQIRKQLLRGDHRALYLAWLVGADLYGAADDEPSPPVPSGLGELDDALEALSSFLLLEPDLLAVAAEGSGEARLEDTGAELQVWLRDVEPQRKDVWLAELLVEGAEAAKVRAEIWGGFRGAATAQKRTGSSHHGRSVGELLARRDELAEARRRREAEEERLRREKSAAEAAARREKHLERLAADEDTQWERVVALIESYGEKNYEAAATLLADLREVHERQRSPESFERQFEVLLDSYRRRPSLMKFMSRKGLIDG